VYIDVIVLLSELMPTKKNKETKARKGTEKIICQWMSALNRRYKVLKKYRPFEEDFPKRPDWFIAVMTAKKGVKKHSHS